MAAAGWPILVSEINLRWMGNKKKKRERAGEKRLGLINSCGRYSKVVKGRVKATGGKGKTDG